MGKRQYPSFDLEELTSRVKAVGAHLIYGEKVLGFQPERCRNRSLDVFDLVDDDFLDDKLFRSLTSFRDINYSR